MEPVEVVKETSASILRQGGPAAWIAVFLVVAGTFAIGYIGRELVPAARGYVTASERTIDSNAQAIASMTSSMDTVHKSHVAMMASLQTTQDLAVSSDDKIDLLISSVEQVSKIIGEAREMMAAVPQARLEAEARQAKLLQQIDASIQELMVELRRTPGAGPDG